MRPYALYIAKNIWTPVSYSYMWVFTKVMMTKMEAHNCKEHLCML